MGTMSNIWSFFPPILFLLRLFRRTIITIYYSSYRIIHPPKTKLCYIKWKPSSVLKQDIIFHFTYTILLTFCLFRAHFVILFVSIFNVSANVSNKIYKECFIWKFILLLFENGFYTIFYYYTPLGIANKSSFRWYIPSNYWKFHLSHWCNLDIWTPLKVYSQLIFLALLQHDSNDPLTYFRRDDLQFIIFKYFFHVLFITFLCYFSFYIFFLYFYDVYVCNLLIVWEWRRKNNIFFHTNIALLEKNKWKMLRFNKIY